ncbi:hypothetical protein [Bradyrhizobium vignae]|uniref:hypothetical protein n=1 Tax=Bradyrhizobium vignae TaxID=1549949 RepID=UPI00100B4D15|nr:hypothetical protein [Bradyrhizobium vignae]RXH05193.1 hypothetical protein EAV90_07300 [Bradyrhizobium vignae]
MKLPPVGWAFFGLIVVLVIGYLLNQGVYVGSSIEMVGSFNSDGQPAYRKRCTYLYLNGTRVEEGMDSRSRAGADWFCAPLHP